MYCKNCGTEIREDSNFCFNCGTKTNISLAEQSKKEKRKEELRFRSELDNLRSLITERITNKILDLLNSVIDSKENGEILIENYQILFNNDLIEDLKKLSNNYERMKSYLQKFIDLEIVDKQYPHNRIGKIITHQTDERELNRSQEKGQFSFVWKVLLMLIIIIVVFKTCLDPSNDNTSDESNYDNRPTYAKIGDEIKIEHFVYRVNSVRFTKSLGNEFIKKTADGIYLIGDLSLKNLDNVEHTLDNSMFKLTNESGTEFESSADATIALEMIGKET